MTGPLDTTAVATALESVRSLLQADGADIELVGLEGEVAELRLVLIDANCAECVLPAPLLQDVALRLMQPQVPGLAAVTIDDPRTA